MSSQLPTLNSQFLTPARLCWVLDIGASTEAEWRAQKRITYFQIGRLIRYPPENVLEFFLRHTIKSRDKLQVTGTNGSLVILSPDEWPKIERLIADQVEARLKAKGQRLKFEEAA